MVKKFKNGQEFEKIVKKFASKLFLPVRNIAPMQRYNPVVVHHFGHNHFDRIHCYFDYNQVDNGNHPFAANLI